MDRQNNPEAASEARARAPLAQGGMLGGAPARNGPCGGVLFPGALKAGRVMHRLSGGLQDGLLVVATLAVLLGVSLGMSALVRWLLSL